MNKKSWSVVLLCLTVIFFAITVAFLIMSAISLFQFENVQIDPLNDSLPGASFIAIMAGALVIFFTIFFVCGGLSAGGFLFSLINIKISQNHIIKLVSKIFLGLNSAVLIFIAVYGAIVLFF